MSAGDSPVAEGVAPTGPDAGPGEQPGDCQTTVADGAPFDTSTAYWREKARVCKIVASRPEGVFFTPLLDALYGRDGWESGGTRYQRVRRFLSSHPNYFRVSTPDGRIFAQPTLSLLDLIKRGIIQNPGEQPGEVSGRRFCRRVLRTVREVNEKGERLLEMNLSEYVERINDLRIVLEARDGRVSPQYVTVPYKTRFNDQGRINKQFAIMSKMLEKAAESHQYAVLLTLTTDPKKHGSIYEMVAGEPDERGGGINGNWNRLMSWLSADERLGYRPEYVKVLEFTEKGYPHLHAVVFLDRDSRRESDGMPWLVDKDDLRRYWRDNCGQGEIVDMQALTYERELPEEYEPSEGWVRWDPHGNHGGELELAEREKSDRESGSVSEGAQTAGQYLGKYLSAIYGGIKETAGLDDEVEAEAAEGAETASEKYEDKAATWKVAMYWATRRKIRTESRDLRAAVEEEVEDDLAGELAEYVRECRYQFVGAYEQKNLPAHIRQESVPLDAFREIVRGKDPPLPPQGEPVPHYTGEREPTRRERLLRECPAAHQPMMEGLLGGESR